MGSAVASEGVRFKAGLQSNRDGTIAVLTLTDGDFAIAYGVPPSHDRCVATAVTALSRARWVGVATSAGRRSLRQVCISSAQGPATDRGTAACAPPVEPLLTANVLVLVTVLGRDAPPRGPLRQGCVSSAQRTGCGLGVESLVAVNVLVLVTVLGRSAYSEVPSTLRQAQRKLGRRRGSPLGPESVRSLRRAALRRLRDRRR